MTRCGDPRGKAHPESGALSVEGVGRGMSGALDAAHPSIPALKVLDLFSGIGGFSLGLERLLSKMSDMNAEVISPETLAALEAATSTFEAKVPAHVIAAVASKA